MTSRDLRWLEVTGKWRHLIGRLLEVAVEDRKLASFLRLTSYKTVARRRRQSRCSKWRHMTSGDRKWPGSDSFARKSPGSGFSGPKTGIFAAFYYLQGCSSHEEAVMWQEITSTDLRWPVMTHKWRNLAGSHLELAVEARKLVSLVRLTSYKAVACWRMQSRDRRWCHVTSRDRMCPKCDVIWPEVTWKWL